MEAPLLASTLRSWRERIGPEEVGLATGPRRRAPGLRRQEVATLAGLSVEYLTRLEQGRATHPSAGVLAPLARALRLSDAERDHLFRLAGHAAPGGPSRHVTPGVQRIIERLADVAVSVLDVTWDVVLQNDLAAALVGDQVGTNTLRRHFGGDSGGVRHEPDDREFERGAVADLRASLARTPEDARLRRLIDDLRAGSERFAALWDSADMEPRVSGQKYVDHPEVGPIAIFCDVLHVEGSALRLVVYTTEPDSPDARALELVRTLGRQRFEPAP